MKVALSLCGGGIKAFMHIGAIKAFEDNNIKFDIVSGTSSGSIIATMYALGYNTEKMMYTLKKYSNSIRYFDLKNIIIFVKNLILQNEFLIDGLNSGDKLSRILAKEFGKINIKDIKIPLIIPAVNILNEKLYVFTNSKIDFNMDSNIIYISDIEIEKAIRASCSYPGVFSPFRYTSTELLVDGGIVENLPWRETKKIGAQKVISIAFVDATPKKCCNNIVQVLDKSFSLLCHELSKYEWNGTDYLIKIPFSSATTGLLKCDSPEKLMMVGYNETIKHINNIKEIISS